MIGPQPGDPAYRQPGHSHAVSVACTPETCTGHPDWRMIRGEPDPGVEYRAVFGSPEGHISHGEPKATLKEAAYDRPPRVEESHAVVMAVEVRPVHPWRAVALENLVAALRQS